MTEINEALLDKIGDLKDIVWMVNSKIKSVREGVELVRSYSDYIAKWTSKINELVIPENQAKSMGKSLKISGYTANIVMITEDNLVHMMDSLKKKDTKVTLFMTKKKIQIVHMPQLLGMIKEIGTNIETVEGWTDPGARRPLAPQPPVNIRRPSPPRRNEAPPRDNSFRKLKQRFNFQFKSLL